MRILSVEIKGFRNYEEAKVILNKESLIIGPNDIGKTNLLYALRILFDKGLSQDDLTLKDSDFNLFNNTNILSIVACLGDFDQIIDEKIIAKYGHLRSNDGLLYIGYKAYKENEDPYEFYMGDNKYIVDNVNCRVDGRTYLNCMYMAYLDSSRTLKVFLKSSKNKMINRYKNDRTEQQIIDDNNELTSALNYLTKINESIEKITYIKDSANFISNKMNGLNDASNSIVLSTVNSFDELEKNVELVSIIDGKKVEIGGDGKCNEIYLIMWIEEQIYQAKQRNSWIFFAIEEPENHLYFPLQSIVAKRIQEYVEDYQLIVSSHSPVVFNVFNPSSIIRIKLDSNKKSIISNNGCTQDLIDPFYTFGFRHNVMTNEMFFADNILLVEGVSEKLLYLAISKAHDNLLEKTNTRVISVDGVGFAVYIKILKSLDINFAVRTDNDYIHVKYGTGRKKTKYNASGLVRLVNLYNQFELGDFVFDLTDFKNLKSNHIPLYLKDKFKEYVQELEKVNLYLSKVDLEYDTYFSPIKSNIEKFYLNRGISEKNDILKEMRESKGNNMFELLQTISNDDLKKITKNSKLGVPLFSICGKR